MIGWFGILFVSVVLLHLKVEAAPATNRELKEQFAIEGTSYKMKCPAITPNVNSSMPGPYIVWSINSRPPRGEKYKLLQDGLVIRNVSKEDTFANYTCLLLDRQTFLPTRAENVVLKIRQREAKLLEPMASEEPVVKDKVKIWGILNQWKVLQCRVFSRPSPTFSWLNQNSEEIKSTPDLFKIVEDESSSNLTIFLHNDTFFGEYICKASNELGESTQNFTLAEGYKPKSPFLFPLLIGKEKITVKLQPQQEHKTEDFLPNKNYFLQFAKLDSLKSSAEESGTKTGMKKKWTTLSKMIGSKTLIETFEIKNLQPNTTYMLRSAVENAAAISDFSSPIRITTDSDSSSQKSSFMNKTEEVGNNNDNNREAHGRSVDDLDANNKMRMTTLREKTGYKKDGKCTHPKFRKTIIITTTSTTLIESIDDSENFVGGNSSLVKKRIEEDTNIIHMDLCNFL